MSGVSWKESLLVSLSFALSLGKSLKVSFCAWHGLGTGEGEPRPPHVIDPVLAEASLEETVDPRDETGSQEGQLGKAGRPELNLS